MNAPNNMGVRPGIILLREGTDTSQGIPQLIANINACQAVSDTIRTTLGPSGRDKLISKQKTTISNDGATLLKLLEIEHPAAQTLVDISMSQDAVVGDGTTSVVLLAAELLTQLKPFLEDNVHPQLISSYIREAGHMAVEKVRELSVDCSQHCHEMLLKIATTALNSKLIANHSDLFAPMVVQAVSNLQTANNPDNDIKKYISVKQIPGGDVRQSVLVNGVAFQKTFSYAGFEQMNKKYDNPKILLLNVELELKSEKENAEVRITDPSDYQRIVDAEWDIIYSKLQKCVDCGAHIILSKLPIGDLATQFFADRHLFCAGRVPEDDLLRVAKACGGAVQTTTNQLQQQANNSVLGTCGLFEETRFGDERFFVFSQCPVPQTSTILLRGGTEQFIAESERSIHDALQVVDRAIANQNIVAGGGAIEMGVSRYLFEHSKTISGKGQWIVRAFCKALEVVPRQLCDNAGFDSTDALAALRQAKSHEMGVDLVNGGICNTYERGVWEPSDNKINSFQAATEAACVILSIDETIIAPRSQDPGAHQTGMMGGGGGGGGAMSNMVSNAMDLSQAGGPQTGNLGPGVSYMKGRGGV